MANHWNSTHAIWHDLSVAQGRPVPARIEHPVALDERPPPLAFPEETEEQFYKDYLGDSSEGVEYNSGPDIALIQKMLQEVEEVATRNSGQELNLKKDSSTADIIMISKLNPEVEEFIPRSIKISKKISQDKETNNDETYNYDKFNLNGGRIDTNRLTPDEKKIIKEQLKSKISDTSNATCAKVKRERNLAIATLLKLHCVPKPAPVDEGPILKSPAYFEKCNGINVQDKKSMEVAVAEKMDSGKIIEGEPPKSIEKVAVTKKLDNGKIITGKPSTEKPQPKDETATLNIKLKVQKWLDDSENRGNKAEKKLYKHKSLYLGPVTFKKKASSKPISPSSTESSEYVRPVEDTVFKPSEYAEELTRKYRERGKAKEREEQTIWTALENELKAKDEAIKNKQATQPESS